VEVTCTTLANRCSRGIANRVILAGVRCLHAIACTRQYATKLRACGPVTGDDRPEEEKDSLMTQSPWWGVPLVAGIFALAGVLTTQLVTVRIERQKYRREIDLQWNNEKRRIYSEFLNECSQALLVLASSRAGQPRDTVKTIDPLKLSFLVYEMQLVASTELSALAVTLSQATQRVILASKGTQPLSESDYSMVRQEAIQASVDFIDRARIELSVSSPTSQLQKARGSFRKIRGNT
jgi:hypothetical protein